MTKNAKFGQNLVVFGQKILVFTGESKSFGTHMTEKKHLDNRSGLSRLSAQKSVFCHMTPILVNGPFVDLGETVHFLCWERFYEFLFPSYGRFWEKIWLLRQKVFPLPVTVSNVLRLIKVAQGIPEGTPASHCSTSTSGEQQSSEEHCCGRVRFFMQVPQAVHGKTVKTY